MTTELTTIVNGDEVVVSVTERIWELGLQIRGLPEPSVQVGTPGNATSVGNYIFTTELTSKGDACAILNV